MPRTLAWADLDPAWAHVSQAFESHALESQWPGPANVIGVLEVGLCNHPRRIA